MAEHLRFAPDILRRLGEELNPNADEGIIELVRNAWDADALTCTIELQGITKPGGTITISDDGRGMDPSDIVNGWLLLGRSKKEKQGLTKRGRLPTGEKGLGRLAALRLGKIATLQSTNAEGITSRLEINWGLFENVEAIESVPLNVVTEPSNLPSGTSIEISDILTEFTRRDVQRLARSLLLLTDPFEDVASFRTKLRVPDYSDLEKRVDEAYFEEAEFKLEAQINSDGTAEALVRDSAGNVLYHADHHQLSKSNYLAPTAIFELWVFILDNKAFTARNVTVREVQDWLKEVGGVHVYRRGLRVRPYGDPGHDWLEMNLSRARSPELRPSTNTAIGRVVVEDPNEMLSPKTDRIGFIENEHFNDLKRFAQEALTWMARERLKFREEQRQSNKSELSPEIVQAKTALDRALQVIPQEARPSVTAAVKQLDRAHEKETETLKEELQLYRTLATVGTTSAVFAHESAQPITRIEKAAIEIEGIVSGELSLFDREMVSELASMIARSALGMSSFANLVLTLVKRDKRKRQAVNVHAVIDELKRLFDPFLEGVNVTLSLEFEASGTPIVWTSSAAIDSIFSNLISNATWALIYAAPKPEGRRILIRTVTNSGQVTIKCIDNGPGITGLPLVEIWIPGQTSKAGGTGLGLTIVRDTVLDMKGEVHAIPIGELGGAEFTIILPIMGGV